MKDNIRQFFLAILKTTDFITFFSAENDFRNTSKSFMTLNGDLSTSIK